MRSSRRTALAVSGVLFSALTLTACGGGGSTNTSKSTDPATALAAAKASFDASSSVHFTMATDSQPTSGDAVLGADGTLTHQPAFKGSVKARYKGFTVDVPVVSVGGKVYAKLPLSPVYTGINPADLGAPDPADFADPASGISGLLTRLSGAKQTGEKRNGKDIVTTYAGTLPGSLVAPIIPSASKSGTYDTVVGIDKDGRIATLVVTGAFFAANGPVTYHLAFDSYDQNVTISAP